MTMGSRTFVAASGGAMTDKWSPGPRPRH